MHIEIPWILFLVRIVLGAVMLYYGWPKIRDLKSNANDFVRMGFKPGMFWGTLIAAVEFFGGLAMVLGLYAELAAALFGFQMLAGTFWKLKIKKPFVDYSYDIQLFALCLIVMSLGAGVYAIAAFPGSIFLRWDVAVAALAGAALLAAFCKPAESSPSERNIADHERDLRIIAALRARVDALKKGAIEEIRADLQRLGERLDRIADRAARELKDLKRGIDAELFDINIGLRLAVDDAKGHLKVIEAKRALVSARLALARNDLLQAEARVESALKDLDEARSLVLGHHENIDELRAQVHDTLVAIRARADTMKPTLDAVLVRTDRLLQAMSGAGAEVKSAA